MSNPLPNKATTSGVKGIHPANLQPSPSPPIHKTNRSVAGVINKLTVLLERVAVIVLMAAHIFAIVLHAIRIRAQAVMNIIDRKHAILIRIIIVRIPDRHTPTHPAPIMPQLLQQKNDLRAIQPRPDIRLLVLVDFHRGEQFAALGVLQGGADGALVVGPADDGFARRGPARGDAVAGYHHGAQLVDHVAVAFAVLVADAAPEGFAAEGAAFAVDAAPMLFVAEDGADEEEAEEGAVMHVVDVGGVCGQGRILCCCCC